MKKFFTALLVVGLGLLAGCNGSSGENTTPGASTQTPATVSILIENTSGVAQQSFVTNEKANVVATLLDNSNNVIAGRTISFDTTIGTLSVASKLTNDDGQAIIQINNEALAAGAGTITATIGGITSTTDFEFISSGIDAASALSSQLFLDGVATRQIKADEQAQIIATLLGSDNKPIVGSIINFTADVGTLSTSTALTNDSGIAKVTLSSEEQTGAGVIVVAVNNAPAITANRINYEIIAADAVVVNEGVKIGHINAGGEFIEGKILVGNTMISAGGTAGLTIDLVNDIGKPITTPTAVTFTSNCVQSSNATIDGSVLSIRGKAKATFEDIDCAGANGTDDVIVASITIDGITHIASETISISGESLGSIEFVSAAPTSIVLKGTGGQGKQETSTLTFLVKSALGNPLTQQQVDFVLDTTVGNITLNPTSGITNSQGIITTQVTAGTVPTAVRVTAKSSMEVDGNAVEVQTQSDLLSINTGLPEQRSLTISTNIHNPEADSNNGVKAVITAQLADNFNNPVPNGTTVNFTTEGGMIEPSCTTINGTCTVTWTSAEPRVSDHRITILATALGHETFFDTNGNNTFDESDGNAIVSSAVSSGFGRFNPQPSGFIDMSEAWRDDNENKRYDAGEVFLDYNNDNTFSIQDSLFNGPQCRGNKCATEGNQAIHVRKSLVMNMASTIALYTLQDSNSVIYRSTESTISRDISLKAGEVLKLTLDFSDTAGQSMPEGTQVVVSVSAGELDGTTTFTVPNTLSTHSMSFNLEHPTGSSPDKGTLVITITAPSGIVTPINVPITLN